MSYEHGQGAKRMPGWMRRPIAHQGDYRAVKGLMDQLGLHTVCQSAKCPNQGECFAAGTATFLVAGDVCTRGCRFCAVTTATPQPLDAQEPAHVAEAVVALGLAHVVITMVTRDDVEDGAAGHVVAVLRAVRRAAPETRIEVLTSDFGGKMSSVDAVIDAGPDVFNHNLETVPRLYGAVRPGAEYARSLAVLSRVKQRAPEMPTKSGLMLGLGETPEEVVEVMRDLRGVGCDMITLGQYLRPSARHLPVAEFVTPEVFESLACEATSLGFSAVASAPFVRSSYHAAEMVTRPQG